jgi:hypothetical protein
VIVLLELAEQLSPKRRNLFADRDPVLFWFFGTDIAPWREDEPLLGNLLERDRGAESWLVSIDGRAGISTPRMVCASYSPNVVVGEFAMGVLSTIEPSFRALINSTFP